MGDAALEAGSGESQESGSRLLNQFPISLRLTPNFNVDTLDVMPPPTLGTRIYFITLIFCFGIV
jgi:hypothetical protein